MNITGEYERRIDAWGRLSIPASIRRDLHPFIEDTKLYLVAGDTQGTLALYPDCCFEKISSVSGANGKKS